MMRKALLTVIAAVAMTTSAHSAIFYANGSNNDGTLQGSANITVSNGSISVILNATYPGMISSGQAISDVEFSVSGITSIGTFTQAGSLVNVNDNGTVTPVGGSPSHWGASLTGFEVHLTTLTGGQPNNLIVGPTPAQNNGFDNFNPYINGTGTFTLACLGCTTSSVLSGVSISFGTNGFEVPTSNDPPPPPAVPEASTWAMMILGFVGVGLYGMRRNRRVRLA